MERYVRQMNLPEIGLTGQEKLKKTSFVMVGAGGLGAPALPYLAAAGIGNITIIDHDTVDITNLHRQTIYRTDQIGLNKAQCAADYLKALNPDIRVTAIAEKVSPEHMKNGFDLILDGSDNFQTKDLLNTLAIKNAIPLLTASVNSFQGQIGLFAGHLADQACYRCLFPDFPLDARNCNEAGILGTTAGILGLYQAHIALLFILQISPENISNFWVLDLKTMRIETIKTAKNPDCFHCHTHKTSPKENPAPMKIEILPLEEVSARNALIVDVRNADELIADPLNNSLISHTPLHIPLPQIPVRMGELPRDKLLALVCAGNVRSVQGAQYLAARGYTNVCVLDKFTV